MIIALALMGLTNNAHAANPEIQAVERRVGSLEWRVAQLEKADEPDAEEIEEITEEAEEIAEDIAECGEPCSDLADRLDTVEADIGTLKTDVETLQGDVGTLKTNVETLQGDVGTLKKVDSSFLSFSVGVANSNVFRSEAPEAIVVGMPWRQHGVGFTAEACGEYVMGTRLALCGYVSPQRYGHEGNYLATGGKAYFLASPQFAVGVSVSYSAEWLGVYDDTPDLFGASSGGLALAHFRVSPDLLGNDVFATDLQFWGGLGPRQNRVMGGAEYWERTAEGGVSLSFRFATEGKRY